jgi:uncharacterized membrane protein YqjE
MPAVITNADDGGSDGLGGIVKRIGDDLKTLAHDEVELARSEVQSMTRGAAAEAAMLVIGAFVALVGMAMLCVTAVIAAEPIIDSLAIRMLIMTAIYLIGGGLVARYAFKKLSRTLHNPLKKPADEAARTVHAVKDAINNEEPHHA